MIARGNLHQVTRAIGSQWISVFYGAAVSALILVFLARRLGPSPLAAYLYIHSIVSLFAIVQDGGFQILIFREKVSPSRGIGLSADALISGYFGYVFLVTVLGTAAVLAFPVIYKKGFILALAYFAFRCITNLVSSVLKGRNDFETEALWRLELNTFLALSVFTLVGLTSPAPEKVFLGLLAGQLLLLATKTGRAVLTRPRLLLPPWHLWKTCLALVMINGASTVYFKSDIILLKHMLPDLALVGQYGAAFQILEGITFFATPVAHFCFRYLRLSWRDRSIFLQRLGKMLAGAVIIGVGAAAAGLLFAPRVIIILYGGEYGPAAEILPVLSLALVFLLPNYILTQGMIAANGEKYYAAAASLCAVFNVSLNLLLIPKYLAAGAAWSTVATEALLTLLLGPRFFRWRDGRDKVLFGVGEKQI